MNVARNLIQGTAGGLLGGAVLGLIEAVYHLSTVGAPDLLAPFYAVVLYGLFGLPLGFGGGLVLTAWERFRRLKRDGDALAFALGTVAAVAPMAAFILNYVLNKVVWLEQGVPLTGKLGILGAVGLYAAFALSFGVGLLLGPLKALLRGPGVLGAFGGLAAITAVVALLPSGGDPRSSWAHGKPVPAGLADAPDVLVIAIDTLRADYLGAYGKEGDPSPTLDAIAADGVVFEQAFAHSSWTRSSFASLWSSRLPSSHDAATKAARLSDEVDLLSEVLQQAGVTTGNLANNINVTKTFNFDQGYDTFIYEAPDYAFGATESVFSLTFYKVVHKLNERRGGGKVVSRFYQPAEVVLGDARGFIEANRDSRWFLGVHLMEPHDPYFEHPYLDGTGTAEFNGVGFARAEVERPSLDQVDYLKRVYLDEIRHMDRKLADFIAWLKQAGLYDDLVIVITSDHGEEFGEHGGFWHGTTLYDEQIHVPLIVKLPGNAHAGTRVPWQVGLIDVAPMVTSLVGVPPSDQWRGRDPLPELQAHLAEEAAAAEAVQSAEGLVAELGSAGQLELAGASDEDLVAAREAEGVLDAAAAAPDPCAPYAHPRERPLVAEQDFEGNVLSVLRKGGFKLLRANEGNPRGLPAVEVYDVVQDPGETTNLVGVSEARCGVVPSAVPDAHGAELDRVIAAADAESPSSDGAELAPPPSCAETVNLCALGYMHGPECCRCGYEAACD